MVLTKIRHIYQKKKIQKCIFALESAFEKKSLFMVVNRSALLPRTQRKKLELIPSYGYGAMSNNVQKCTKCARMRAF